MFNRHGQFPNGQQQQQSQHTQGFPGSQLFQLPGAIASGSVWTTPLSGQGSNISAGQQSYLQHQSSLMALANSASAAVGEKRRFEQIASGENKENLPPSGKRQPQQSSLHSAKTESPEEGDEDEEESDNSNNSSGSTNNTTSAGDEDVSSESESLLPAQQGQLGQVGQLGQLLPYSGHGGSGLGGLYPAQPVAHSTPHMAQQQSTSAGMSAFTAAAAANYWYTPSGQAAQGAVLAQHLQSTAHMAASYLAGGFAQQQQHQHYGGDPSAAAATLAHQQGYSFSNNRGGGAMDGSYLGQLPSGGVGTGSYHTAAAVYNPFSGSWHSQPALDNVATPLSRSGNDKDDSGIVNTSGGDNNEGNEPRSGPKQEQSAGQSQQLALTSASQAAAGALNPYLNRYTGVPGRLALLSHNRKYSVTFGEVCRRISPPECLNASYLGGILRKAKNKNGGKALREELKKYGIYLPSGRRKSAPVTVFTSLCEQEAEQMAIDFCKLNEAEFPREELADALLQSAFAGHTGGPQQKLALMAGANQLVQEAIAIVAVVEKAASGVPMAPPNLSIEEQRKLEVVEHATKEGLIRFSRLTHGFGNLAMLTAWRCFQEVLSHCAVKLRAEGGEAPGTSSSMNPPRIDASGRHHHPQQGLTTPANSSSSSSGSSNTSSGGAGIGASGSGSAQGTGIFS